MSVPKLTESEIEKYTGVSGLDEAKLLRNVIGITSALQRLATMFSMGKVVAVGGAGMTGLPTVVATGGYYWANALGARFMLFTGIGATVGAVINVFLSLGLPVAQAKDEVRKREIRWGFSCGVAIGVLGYGRQMRNDFYDPTISPGFAPSYMAGVAQDAYNAGLLIGYAATIKLTADERLSVSRALTDLLIAEAKERNGKLYMEAWSDRDWVLHYARAVSKACHQ